MADTPRSAAPHADSPAAPQVWHQYGMSSAISVALLDPALTSAHDKALHDAWDVLVVRDEWRTWVRENLIPPAPLLVLRIRPGIDKRRLRKTKAGVSMNLPAAEIHEADRTGQLIPL